ncbi:primosomal replication protein [Gilliamella sp. B2923]|uniref:primosomal replication protein PriC n=1 Tax=Gilliamella sp. B2923 TaxID=2818005 RepID=UPI002269A94F|nr:primosomal replication protein PriC [Gilliamella sp. B2923]MCX8618211.1 primosomal replication protein [Gilliamella sp. B2923]
MQKFLAQLDAQITALEQQIKLSDQQPFQEHYFDEQLFNQPKIATNCDYYLEKIKLTYQALCDSVHSNKLEQMTFLSDKLINQMTALTRELATHQLRQNKSDTVFHETLYEKHSRHLDYLRRLQEMKYELELSAEPIDHVKIATLDNRIYRCEKAIEAIELEMESAGNTK